MKKKIFILILFITSIFLSSYNFNTNITNNKGEVIWEDKGCDYYIIETNQWFVLVELYNGTLNEGDKVEGELHTYNFKYLTNNTRGDKQVKVWIENYWSNKERCFEWLKDHNKCNK